MSASFFAHIISSKARASCHFSDFLKAFVARLHSSEFLKVCSCSLTLKSLQNLKHLRVFSEKKTKAIVDVSVVIREKCLTGADGCVTAHRVEVCLH